MLAYPSRQIHNLDPHKRARLLLCSDPMQTQATPSTSSTTGPVLSHGSATLLACRKWCAGIAGVVGHRVGYAVLRRKNVVKRYEVGYRTLVSVSPERWVERFLGNGTSWDQAFAEAQDELEVQW